MTFWQMHEAAGTGRKPYRTTAILTGAILLFLTVEVFRSPVSTFPDPVSLALHAYQLSKSDSTSAADLLPVLLGNGSTSLDRLAPGSHCMYPFRILSVRDLQSGAAIIRILSPGKYLDRDISTTIGEHRMELHADGNSITVMVDGIGAPSWSEEVLSIITNR